MAISGRERPIRLTTTMSDHVASRQAGIGQQRPLERVIGSLREAGLPD
jgi:hypothetical protein